MPTDDSHNQEQAARRERLRELLRAALQTAGVPGGTGNSDSLSMLSDAIADAGASPRDGSQEPPPGLLFRLHQILNPSLFPNEAQRQSLISSLLSVLRPEFKPAVTPQSAPEVTPPVPAVQPPPLPGDRKLPAVPGSGGRGTWPKPPALPLPPPLPRLPIPPPLPWHAQQPPPLPRLPIPPPLPAHAVQPPPLPWHATQPPPLPPEAKTTPLPAPAASPEPARPRGIAGSFAAGLWRGAGIIPRMGARLLRRAMQGTVYRTVIHPTLAQHVHGLWRLEQAARHQTDNHDGERAESPRRPESHHATPAVVPGPGVTSPSSGPRHGHRPRFIQRLFPSGIQGEPSNAGRRRAPLLRRMALSMRKRIRHPEVVRPAAQVDDDADGSQPPPLPRSTRGMRLAQGMRRALVMGRRRARGIGGTGGGIGRPAMLVRQAASTVASGTMSAGTQLIAAGGMGAVGGAAAAAAGTVGMVIGLGVVAAAAALAVGAAAKKFADHINESNRQIANYNGRLSAAFTHLDVSRFHRDVKMANETSGSGAGLAKAINEMEHSLHPFNRDVKTIMNFTAGNLAYGVKLLGNLYSLTREYIPGFSMVLDAIEENTSPGRPEDRYAVQLLDEMRNEQRRQNIQDGGVQFRQPIAPMWERG